MLSNATLGINKPRSFDSINNSADLLGVAVPIPTWALVAKVPNKSATGSNLFFIYFNIDYRYFMKYPFKKNIVKTTITQR